MPKEILKPDAGLLREFQNLIDDQDRKISRENRKRNALWALEALIQDKEVSRETTYDILVQIVRERIRELRKTSDSAKYVKEENKTDEIGIELGNVAGEEMEKSERLLRYFKEAASALADMNMPGFRLDTKVGEIYDKFKKDVDMIEAGINYEEARKRIDLK